MVCGSVRENNPRILASELSPVETQKHTIACLLHKQCICTLYIVRYLKLNIGLSVKGAINVITVCFTDFVVVPLRWCLTKMI